EIAGLKSEQRQLSSAIETLTESNVSSQEKIEVAKVLNAANIRLQAIDLRKGGKKEKETTKAKRVDIVRIIFDINENKLAESGSKELLLVIKDPEGELLSNAALGSGRFTTADDETKYYTLSK